ncbi:class I SAM-dependent methyltransferase [Psychroserpens sp. XS_ASV72]|uniref:class I SAM-dependent methyltransferase n=1 Tax=Psychroserpens sp. XS_ASV72 TaxID=3241293 RepID=UPI0035147F1C
MFEILKKILNKLPYVRTLHKNLATYKKDMHFPPGHFYSPIVSREEIKKKEHIIWNTAFPETIEGIDLQVDNQKALLEKLKAYYDEIPFPESEKKGTRYYFKNKFYSYTDGITLYSMLRHFKPKKVVEIGSGFSSAMMLDVNELFLDNQTALTFIEPYPTRLNSLITESDKQQTEIIEAFVQNVDMKVFKSLSSGDILFIDSSHIVKTGSDLNHILFHILPQLNSGVLIHFHDVFYPFEYPKRWVLGGFNWNEDYFLRAFLMYNTDFEVVLFTDYLHKCHSSVFECMPMTYKNTGGNFWIRKK